MQIYVVLVEDTDDRNIAVFRSRGEALGFAIACTETVEGQYNWTEFRDRWLRSDTEFLDLEIGDVSLELWSDYLP